MINLLATHLSTALTTKPSSLRTVTNSSYYNKADLIISYNAFKICTYNTFLPFSYLTSALYSGLTLFIMSTNCPSIFNKTNFDFGMYACKYAPDTSKTATFLFSYPKVMSNASSDSRERVGELASSLGT